MVSNNLGTSISGIVTIGSGVTMSNNLGTSTGGIYSGIGSSV